MTQKEKELLLIDLCARLPYGVKFLRESWNYEWDHINKRFPIRKLSIIEVLEDIDKDGFINNTEVYTIEDIKPYLRPMSSMTEKEKEELFEICTLCTNDGDALTYEYWGVEILHHSRYGMKFENNYSAIDWLNAHHFDYRDLIEKGLAIAVTEENNPYKNVT